MPILWQPNEGKHSSIYIHHPTNPNPRGNLLKSQEHVQVTLRHTQTYVSTWCNACWWYESDNLHTNPSVSQRTRTFTNHHPTYIHPPPTNYPTCTQKTTQRPINHHVHSISPPASFNIHLSTVLTSHHQKEYSAARKHAIASRYRIRAKQALWNLIRKSRNSRPKRAWHLITISRTNSVHQKAWHL